MGASLDWSRLSFTLDDQRKKAVQRMFIDMYEAGVIYRGERLVNWCPRCHSTLADDEVEYKEQQTKLYTFRYSQDCPIIISTTRPETKLGDTAIAVNPKDKRYQEEIGKTYDIDFCGQKLNLKVIADHNVDQNFGTGALGVTPAHSAVDWQMAELNNLEKKKVIDENANILNGFGDYSGLSVLDARTQIIDDLRKRGLMIKEEEISNNLSCCYRCDTPIEPLPSRQWFVAVDKPLERLGGKSMKQAALDLAKTEEIKFLPVRFTKRYNDWMENLHDWCISRQIWFGHSIPAWYRGDEICVSEESPHGDGWIKDGDTLDTWFSSGMWSFSTLGWPDNYIRGEKKGDLARFHPTQTLETGYEILTLWVSRMIMMSLFALGEKPFSLVYLHGTILDEKGKKMSKSKGNGIDPLEVIDKYGADAVRLSLLMGATPGNDARYSEEKIAAKRNFINKLWNISRFILSSVDSNKLDTGVELIPETVSLSDKWIINEIEKLKSTVTLSLDHSEFSVAAEVLYDFTWNKLADWYLEIAKIEKGKDELLIYLLKNILIMWHPFIPFVTEAIWQSFNNDLLMINHWPVSKNSSNKNIIDYNDFIFVQESIIAIRNARSQNKIEPSKKVKAVIIGEKADILRSQSALIIKLKTGIEDINISKTAPEGDAIKIVLGATEIYLLGAIDHEKEKTRLLKEKEQLIKLITGVKSRLNDKEFSERAPVQVIEAEREKFNRYELELEKINQALEINI